MPSAVLTPFTPGPAQRAGSLWWKRILPVGSIDYKGRQLNFTRPYNDALAQAFTERAYDQVPFQLADAANSHTNDPERFRGDIVAMDSRDDGLWVGLSATPAGDQVLETNPNLGVSARIVEDYSRSDGVYFPAAIQHVLGTLDPRIPQLGPWQRIEMSNAPEQVLDLSGYQFSEPAPGGAPMTPTDRAQRLEQLLQLPADQLEALLSGTALGTLTDEELAALNGGEGGDGDISDEELADIIASLPPEELAALEAEFQAEMASAGSETGLTAEGAMALEMANYRADENARELSVIREHLDEQTYLNERNRIARDLGIPPYIVDLARPLLEGSGRTVELSGGRYADAGQIMRSVLTEFGRAAQMLDLGMELGSPMDEPEGQQAGQAARNDVVSRFRAQTGI